MSLTPSLLLLLVALPSALLAQPSTSVADTGSAVPSVHHGRLRQTTMGLPKSLGGVKVDGQLDEAAWRSAAVLTGFSQYAPIDGVPPADSTEVLVMYSDHEIYFGIRAYEAHGPVHATHADRDRIGSDDHVQFLSAMVTLTPVVLRAQAGPAHAPGTFITIGDTRIWAESEGHSRGTRTSTTPYRVPMPT